MAWIHGIEEMGSLNLKADLFNVRVCVCIYIYICICIIAVEKCPEIDFLTLSARGGG